MFLISIIFVLTAKNEKRRKSISIKKGFFILKFQSIELHEKYELRLNLVYFWAIILLFFFTVDAGFKYNLLLKFPYNNIILLN